MLCKEFLLDFWYATDLVSISCIEVLRVRQDNNQISSCWMLWFASPTTYRTSRFVRKRIDRLFSASMWANMLLHLVLELEVRVEEYSALSSKAPSDRNHLSAFGIGRHNLIGMTDGPLFGAAFTGIAAISMMMCFLRSLRSGTLVRYAQGRPWRCGPWVRCARKASPGCDDLHKWNSALLLRQRIAPNCWERRIELNFC